MPLERSAVAGGVLAVARRMASIVRDGTTDPGYRGCSSARRRPGARQQEDPETTEQDADNRDGDAGGVMTEHTGDAAQAAPGALVVPVGGTLGAPVRALQEVNPDWVAFVVSPQTVSQIAEIERELGRTLPWKRVIVTPDAQDLNDTYRRIVVELPRVLEEWGIGWERVVVDLTGGTKVMTAALTLATVHRAQRYLYVGGEERDRGGTGVVITGHERPVQAVNPWEQYATAALRRFAGFFNRLQFAAAISVAREAEGRVAVEKRVHLAALADLAEGFAAWDRFDHRIAKRKLEKSLEPLAQEWARDEAQRRLIDRIRACVDTLDDVLTMSRREAPSRPLLRDLLSNAVRRGEIEQRYDDAVARLYRFVEGTAQQALWDDFGIKTGAVPAGVLPGTGDLGAIKERAASRGQSIVELPLQRAYELLEAKGHGFGEMSSRVQRGGAIGRCLVARNNSLLAHGTEPVGPSTYERLLGECLALAGWTREDLTVFPALAED
jgi:CRISPR-associated protein (TIGR02710 family)